MGRALNIVVSRATGATDNVSNQAIGPVVALLDLTVIGTALQIESQVLIFERAIGDLVVVVAQLKVLQVIIIG